MQVSNDVGKQAGYICLALSKEDIQRASECIALCKQRGRGDLDGLQKIFSAAAKRCDEVRESLGADDKPTTTKKAATASEADPPYRVSKPGDVAAATSHPKAGESGKPKA